MINQGTKSLFPLTYAEPHEKLPLVDEVCLQIFKLYQSPYAAWLNVLEIDRDQLPELMGLSKEAAKFYLKNPHLSPHPDNVRKFCDNLGVHPAYLQPAFYESSPVFHYHPSILGAIRNVLDEPKASGDDRELSLLALRSESLKLDRFISSYANTDVGRLLQCAMEYHTERRQQLSKTGVSPRFMEVSQGREPRLEQVLEQYMAHLNTELSVLAHRKNYKTSFVNYLRHELMELNDFSSDTSGLRLETFVCGIERQARMAAPWNSEVVAARYKKIFPIDGERPDKFSLASRQKAIGLLPLYVDERKKRDAITHEYVAFERTVQIFNRAALGEDMNEFIIPLFDNARLAKRALSDYEHVLPPLAEQVADHRLA